MKTLNQDCPYLQIIVSKFWSFCSPNGNPILETQLTGFSLFPCLLQHIIIARSMIKFFIFISRLTKAEVLICIYVDVDFQGYSYKNILQNYASNLHKRVPAGTFPHKPNAFTFHCNTHRAASLSQNNISGFLNSSVILRYIAFKH